MNESINQSKCMESSIECEGWRRHSSLIFLILLFTKPNIEVRGWLYQTKTHFTHIIYQPFSRVSPPSFTLYGVITVEASVYKLLKKHKVLRQKRKQSKTKIG